MMRPGPCFMGLFGLLLATSIIRTGNAFAPSDGTRRGHLYRLRQQTQPHLSGLLEEDESFFFGSDKKKPTTSPTPAPTMAPVIEPVKFIIGSNNTKDLARVIFTSRPYQPFVWTNFREGHLSLTYGTKHLLTFGVSSSFGSVSNSVTGAPGSLRFRAVHHEESSYTPSAMYSDEDDEVAREKRRIWQSPLSYPVAEPNVEDYIDEGGDADSFLETGAVTQATPLSTASPSTAPPGATSAATAAPSATSAATTAPVASVAPAATSAATASPGATLPATAAPTTPPQSVTAKPTAKPTANPTGSPQPQKTSDPNAPEPVPITPPHQQIAPHSFMHSDDMIIEGTLSVMNHNPIIADVPQWSLVHIDDFEEDATGWSDETRQICTADNVFLGGFCKAAALSLSKTFGDLPPHRYLRLKANFHYFDRWTGEWGFAKINNNTVWTQKHHFCPQIFSENCRGINVCGDEAYSDQLSTLVEVVIPHTGPTVKIEFGSSLSDRDTNQGCLASYGVDDVIIETMM